MSHLQRSIYCFEWRTYCVCCHAARNRNLSLNNYLHRYSLGKNVFGQSVKMFILVEVMKICSENDISPQFTNHYYGIIGCIEPATPNMLWHRLYYISFTFVWFTQPITIHMIWDKYMHTQHTHKHNAIENAHTIRCKQIISDFQICRAAARHAQYIHNTTASSAPPFPVLTRIMNNKLTFHIK